MIQFDEHIFQMGWFNHQVVHDETLLSDTVYGWKKSGSTHQLKSHSLNKVLAPYQVAVWDFWTINSSGSW